MLKDYPNSNRYMSLFKIKNNKIIVPDNRVTLDAKHNSTVKQFKDDKKNLNNLKKELEILYKNLSDIKSKPLKKMSIVEIEEKYVVEDKITNLSQKIKDITFNSEG